VVMALLECGICQVRWKKKFVFPSEEVIDYFLATNTVLETFHFIHAPVFVSLLVRLHLDRIDEIIDEQAYFEGADAE
jgi:hypothetical protein